jgi:signal transduction histidine kinase
VATGSPQTALESVTWRRFLVSSWPWRSTGYLLTTPFLWLAAGLPLGFLCLPWIPLVVSASEGTSQPIGTMVLSFLAGVALLALGGPLVALPLCALERRRLRIVDSRTVRSGHHQPPAPGLWSWLRTRYGEAATWRALGYTVLFLTVAPPLYLAVLLVPVLIGAFIASPALVSREEQPIVLGWGTVSTADEALPYSLAGLALLPAVPYLLAVLAGVHGAVARALLDAGDDEQLRAELVEVSRSRARLVDAFEAERRRIERDLHDGAQRRLVGLTLQLGLAKLDIPADLPAAKAVADAHEQAKQVMAELRALIRGIHPQVLTDRGLPAALNELADELPIPVSVSIDLPGRLARHLEATAYFVVAEALTNVVKHSGAAEASVTVRQPADVVIMEVKDDGRGGADLRRGSGLAGLADRVAVAEGRMFLSSPPGGPTVLRVELACHQHHPPSA